MNDLLPYFILIPCLGYLLNILAPGKRESLVFWTAIGAVGTNLMLFLGFAGRWAAAGCPDLHFDGPVLYASGDAEFAVDLFFNWTTAGYFFVASVLTTLVAVFSRYYLHREKGFKRFFNNVVLFYLGLSVILFAGNFETLFIGWEIIGITSFFLIAFYRERYLPVKNALKVVSIYRVADIFLLLGIWVCHHHFLRSITFAEMQEMYHRGIPVIDGGVLGLVIPFIFLVVALVKSAQWPFSSWLPRAMEGPTTSSAIFYGSLSVHIGIFLLLRTYPFWAENWVFKAIVIVFGLFTVIVATFTARVQSSVKTQIAYSSVAQIGLMFVEVALGWHGLAMLHFAGNAFLRTYQLLVSPSVLSYLIHDQFFNFIPPQHHITDTFWGRLRLTVFVLSVKEWHMDAFMYRFLWQPLKSVGRWLGFIGLRGVLFGFVPMYAAGLFLVYHQERVPGNVLHYMSEIMAFLGLVLMFKAFVERGDARRAWLLIVLSQLFVSLAVGFNEQFDFAQVHIYLSGILVSALIGYWCFYRLQMLGESLALDRFQGHFYEHPRLLVAFLVACLGLAGFPITPTFIGEDLILGHIHERQFVLTGLVASGLIVGGLAIFRVYARLFLGPHEKGYHEVAYRSS